MEKLEFNPTIIDYSPNPEKEYIAPGVYKYVDSSEPSLKDAIENLSFEELKQAFEEKRSPHRKKGLQYFPTPLTKLFNEYLEPKGISMNEGTNQVYNLICEKIAMDWINENLLNS